MVDALRASSWGAAMFSRGSETPGTPATGGCGRWSRFWLFRGGIRLLLVAPCGGLPAGRDACPGGRPPGTPGGLLVPGVFGSGLVLLALRGPFGGAAKFSRGSEIPGTPIGGCSSVTGGIRGRPRVCAVRGGRARGGPTRPPGVRGGLVAGSAAWTAADFCARFPDFWKLDWLPGSGDAAAVRGGLPRPGRVLPAWPKGMPVKPDGCRRTWDGLPGTGLGWWCAWVASLVPGRSGWSEPMCKGKVRGWLNCEKALSYQAAVLPGGHSD
jgi:hypothetical protein